MLKIVAFIVVVLNGEPVFDRALDRDDAPFETAALCEQRLAEVRDQDVTALTDFFRPSVTARWGEQAEIQVNVHCVFEDTGAVLVEAQAPVMGTGKPAPAKDDEHAWDLLAAILRHMNRCGGLAQVGAATPCPHQLHLPE